MFNPLTNKGPIGILLKLMPYDVSQVLGHPHVYSEKYKN